MELHFAAGGPEADVPGDEGTASVISSRTDQGTVIAKGADIGLMTSQSVYQIAWADLVNSDIFIFTTNYKHVSFAREDTAKESLASLVLQVDLPDLFHGEILEPLWGEILLVDGDCKGPWILLRF